MCRFSGSNDPEYCKVASALQRIASNQYTLDGNSSRRLADPDADSFNPTHARREELKASLKFDQLDSRFQTVERAHSKTCQWLLDKAEYKNWLAAQFSDPRGFLWIKGKPGVGKSTIMKFALSQAKKALDEHAIFIYFFFNARGAELERSAIGLYRSLLFQLFQAAPHTQSVLDTAPVFHLASATDGRWHIQTLQDLFRAAVELLQGRSLVCFVDALDECYEDEVRDMISHFQDLGDLAASVRFHLRICFSSRHYPYISIGRGVSLVLESQEEHDLDIANYIASELRIGEGHYVPGIRERIQAKSSGIFLWAILVVRILNKQYDRGNIPALQKRLDEIPRGLSELFEDILTRDRENIQSLWLCLQWVLFSTRPLTREELYFAIMTGSDASNPLIWDRQVISIPDIGRYILNCSKGLTEVTKKTFHVQFIHESVRDFLLKENGLGKLWPELQDNFEAKSHHKLRQCCEVQMNFVNAFGRTFSHSPSPSQQLSRRFPFLNYAVRNVFKHADAAHRLGEQQIDFLTTFDLSWWISLNNIIERFPVRHYTERAHLLYILSEQNAPSLASALPEIRSHHQIKGERFGSPLCVAFARGHIHMIRQLLLASAGPNLCACGISQDVRDLKDLTGSKATDFLSAYSILDSAIRRKCYVTFHILVKMQLCDLRSMDEPDLKSLVFATFWKDKTLAFLLLTHGFKKGEGREWRQNVLTIATSRLKNKSTRRNVNRRASQLARARARIRDESTYRTRTEILKQMINSGDITLDGISLWKRDRVLTWLTGENLRTLKCGSNRESGEKEIELEG